MASLSTSVIIPTYRRADALRRTLAGLLVIAPPADGMEVVVVDNADDRDTRAVVAEAGAQGLPVMCLVASRGGAAAARNSGARQARGSCLVFMDDDMVPTNDAMLKLHLETHERFGRALVVGRWTYPPEILSSFGASPFGRWRMDLERSWAGAREHRPLGVGCIEVHTVSASNLSIDRGLFWQLGGFNERYPYAGAEDQDLSNRAVDAACRLVLNKEIHTHHYESWISFAQYCRRQERGAHSVVHLSREFPDRFRDSAFVRENQPVTPGDTCGLVLKKRLKAVLSTPLPLAIIGKLVTVAERKGLPERELRRVYWSVAGLFLFRGFRCALVHSHPSTERSAFHHAFEKSRAWARHSWDRRG